MVTEEQRVCLITGGSSGIGLATAKQFASKGYHVAICARNETRLSEAVKTIQGVANGGEVYSRSVDLSESNSASEFGEEVISHFGRVDVLVNNAGLAPLRPMAEISNEEFEQVLNVNVKGVFYLSQVIWKQMLEQGGGTIVNVSSLAAVDPFPGFSIYGASKAWMDLMTQALAAEGGDSGIRVCSVRPGAVETPLLRGLFPDFPADQCVGPEEIANKIWACVSDPDGHPSGQAFPVTNQPTT